MRKEILFAIIAGALFGLVIAFGIWKANSSIESNGAEVEETTTAVVNELPLATSEFSITIAKPEYNQVLTNNPVKISGLTKPNVWVVISTEDTDYMTKSQDNGAFEKDIDLTGGVNEIVFNAYDENGASSQSRMILVYSTEFDDDESEGSDEN